MTPDEKKAYMREYAARPEVKARNAVYKSTPEYKAAHAAKMREARKNNPEKFQALDKKQWQGRKDDPEYLAKARVYGREWVRKRRQEDPEFRAKSIADSTAYLKAHPEKVAAYKRKQAYGITKEQWDAMFAAQGSCCAICKSIDPHGSKGWQTDHCHDTGKVRGILCADCNRVVHSRATVDTLDAALAYLKKAP